MTWRGSQRKIKYRKNVISVVFLCVNHTKIYLVGEMIVYKEKKNTNWVHNTILITIYDCLCKLNKSSYMTKLDINKT